MTDNAVGRFDISGPGWTIVAFSTVGMPKSGMQFSRCVAPFTGDSVMCKYLGCGSGRGASTALRMTHKAFSSIVGIMAFY
mgnify:CR=1 FL=1